MNPKQHPQVCLVCVNPLFSLTVGAIAGVAAAVGLAFDVVATAAGVGVAGAAGGAIFGGAPGGYRTHSYICKYEEIKTETGKLCCLRFPKRKQMELHRQVTLKREQIESLIVSE